MKTSDPWCACGHPQSFHERGHGRCKHGCGCLRLKAHRSRLEVLEVLDKGKPPGLAPTYQVRCPECRREYPTRAWMRDIVTRQRCRRCADKRRVRRPGAGANRPSDLPSTEAFLAKACGTRAKYVAGCRCDACREANNAYARLRGKMKRAGEFDRLVDAARVERHLRKLSRRHGIGLRTVADVAGVARSSLNAIVAGRKVKLREQTAARILAVTKDAIGGEATLVSAASTWKLIAKLLAAGFTRGAIARRLGHKTAALQMRKDRITARTRERVARLFREIDP